MPTKTSERKRQRRAEDSAQEPARRPTQSGPQADILALQDAAGNRAVNQLLQPGAESVPSVVADVLKSGGGQPLEPATRAHMEERFGQDFSGVRVHTDARGAASAEAINAQAYTIGQEVVVGKGQYQPQTTAGKRLLAHELAHVVQQSQGPRVDYSTSSHVLEQEADTAAKSDTPGNTSVFIKQGSAPQGSVQKMERREARDPEKENIQKSLRAVPESWPNFVDNPKFSEVVAENSDISQMLRKLPEFQKWLRDPSLRPAAWKPEEVGTSQALSPQQSTNEIFMESFERTATLSQKAEAKRPMQLSMFDKEESPGILGTITGGLLGEFNEDPTYAMIGVDTVASLIPIVDQICDVRDLTAHLVFMVSKEEHNRPMRWVALAFSLIGVVPEIGSAIKGVSKFVGKGIAENLDNILNAIRPFFPKLENIGQFRQVINESWNTIVSLGTAKWNEALQWAVGVITSLRTVLPDLARRYMEVLGEIRQQTPEMLKKTFEDVKSMIDEWFAAVDPRQLASQTPAGSVPMGTSLMESRKFEPKISGSNPVTTAQLYPSKQVSGTGSVSGATSGGTASAASGKKATKQGKAMPLEEGQVTEMRRFGIPERIGDKLAGHEVVMVAWLKRQKLITKRGDPLQRYNSAIALKSKIHKKVNALQKKYKLYDKDVLDKMTFREVIYANAKILLEAGAPIEHVADIVDDAMEMLTGLVGKTRL